MPSPESPCPLDPGHRRILLGIARASIRHGLAHGCPVAVDLGLLPPAMAAEGATFTTLMAGGRLRGCAGFIEATRPLAEDAAASAFAAAFGDSRFPPVTGAELDGLDLHLSLLTPPERILFSAEADLLAQLEPGRDGLLIRSGRARGAFLPEVWEDLPEPEAFLRHLKRKAGLPGNVETTSLEVYRFRTLSIGG